jgi:hypothetical protein
MSQVNDHDSDADSDALSVQPLKDRPAPIDLSKGPPVKIPPRYVPTHRPPIKIDPYKSAQKLEAVGFDPIVAMQQQYDYISQIIEQAVSNPNRTPSMVALSSMMSIQERLATSLAKYGYAVIAQKGEETPENAPPKRIILTK